MQLTAEKLQELVNRVTKEIERHRTMTDTELRSFVQTMIKNEVVPQQYLTIRCV